MRGGAWYVNCTDWGGDMGGVWRGVGGFRYRLSRALVKEVSVGVPRGQAPP